MQIDATYAAHLHADHRADEAAHDVEAGQQFEGYLLEMMIREMRKTVPDGIFSNQAMEMFGGMLDQAVADEVSSTGGLGLAEMIRGSIASEEGAGVSLRIPTHRRRGGVQMPIEGGRISSWFGKRKNPFNREHTHFHKGLDIAAPKGTPIRPIQPGRVEFAGTRRAGGNMVIIDHGNGWKSTYAHCDTLNVKPGQSVGRETTIGTVGSTGASTGPHLHLQLQHHDELVDPAEVLGIR
ncbi:MAG: peptidoglycan DD-metalloendopeptidase family protein [Myxococcota bacterium]